MSEPRRLVLIAALSVLFVPAIACDGGSGSAPGQDVADSTPDAVAPLPDFDLQIQPSAQSGNAPLTIDFTVSITGAVGANDLHWAWSVDGAPVGDEPALNFSFYRAGAATVRVDAEYRASDGRTRSASHSVVVRIQGCANLTFDRLTLEPPTDAPPGGDFTIRFARLYNEGDRIEHPFDVLVALSTNEVYDPADIEVERWTVPAMESGLFEDVFVDYAGRTITLPADVPEGNYFVFIVADPDDVISECQENNNVERSTNNLTVAASAAFRPDLAIRNVSLPAGLTVTQGDMINYSFTIANDGLGDSGQFRFGFWLSEDQELSEDDRVVAAPSEDASKVNNLGPGQSLPFFKSWRVPADLPDGEYWLIGVVDPAEQVSEENRDNNLAVAPNPLTVRYEDPACFDLAFVSLAVQPLSTYWNGSVQLTATISNPGTQPTPDQWLLRAYLSLQPSLNPSTASQAGNWRLPSIPAGETRVHDLVIPIPNTLPVLPHYVGAILDPTGELTECSKANNAAQFPQPITIAAVASVDLAVGPIVYHPQAVTAGQTVKLEYDLSNLGTSGATAFEIGFVLSEDASITRASIQSGTDVVIARELVSGLMASSTVTRVDDVVIPVALDHRVSTWYLGVVADIDRVIGQDNNQSNNIAVAPAPLNVSGTQGGCFEDDLEPNNSPTAAAPLTPGLHPDLGACGNADWFAVEVPEHHSLLVDVLAEPILSLSPVPSDLIVELRDPAGALVDRSDLRTFAQSVRAYAVPAAGTYTVGVLGRTAAVRAHYQLAVEVRPPADGVDLLPYSVAVAPSSIYPGGLVNASWREVNLGEQAGGATRTRLWASVDRQLDRLFDVPLAEVELDGLPGLTERPVSLDVRLPSGLAGGDWYVLVEVDADGDVLETDEDNNVASSDAIFLDPNKTCAEDPFEPNDELAIAAPLEVEGGHLLLTNLSVCPGLPDWYAITVETGTALKAVVSYPHTASSGLLSLAIWDPSTESRLYEQAVTSNPTVEVPWTWLAGTYYLEVSNRAQGSNIGPYTYSLEISATPGLPANACEADVYEDNNSPARARPVGCGLLEATLCKADLDWYILETAPGQEVRLTMAHPRAETRLRLYTNTSANPVASRLGNGLLTYTLPAGGPVYALVDPRTGPLSMTEFPYELLVEGIAGVDLAVASLSTPVSSVFHGEDVLVGFELLNGCTEDAGPFDVRVWLSLGPTLDGTAVPLATLPIAGGLAAGEALPLAPKVTIPASTLAGDYYLIVEADPAGAIPEVNVDNNVAAVPLHVREVCLPDAYEPNDFISVPEDAPQVWPPGVDDLTICPFDQDWFRVEVPGGSTLTVSILFSHDEGDLDLRLYDAAYSLTVPVASSTSSTDDETIVWSVPFDGTYLIRVAGFAGASAGYDLVVAIE